jgi:type IV secretory pathway TraG/TraD family ATPase VirD4
VGALQSLADYPQLNPSPTLDPSHLLSMRKIIEEGGILIANLNTPVAPPIGRIVSSLLTYASVTAARDLYREGKRKQAYLAIDEFQMVLGENTAQVLQMARQAGPALILANQDFKALRLLNSVDLTSTVLTNCSVKQFFAVHDPDLINYLIKLSGEDTKWRAGINDSTSTSSEGGVTHTSGMSHRESIEPGLSINDLIDKVNSDPLGSILLIGGKRPVFVQSTYPTTMDEYEKRLQTPWPRESLPTPPPPQPTPPPPPDPGAQQRQAAMKRAAQKLKRKKKASGT